jgi:hypothetical protein
VFLSCYEYPPLESMHQPFSDVCAGDASCGPGNCQIKLGCDTIVDLIGASVRCIACTLSLLTPRPDLLFIGSF